MNRQEKEQVIQVLRQNFQESGAAFLVGFSGLSVSQLQHLRKDLRAKGGQVKVAKARLMKLAAVDVPGAKSLGPFFHDQVALVFTKGESSAVAKVLYDFSKEHEALALVAGYSDSVFLDAKEISTIAMLPSREQLLAKLCGTLKAPLGQFVQVLKALVSQPIWALKHLEELKAREGK